MEAASDVSEVIGNDPDCYGRRGAGTDFEKRARWAGALLTRYLTRSYSARPVW